MAEPGSRGGGSPRILADQLALSQPGGWGAEYVRHISTRHPKYALYATNSLRIKNDKLYVLFTSKPLN